MDDTESLTLGDLEKILFSTMRRHSGYWRHTDRQDLEDAIQEGLIHAWKDMQSGKYEKDHIIARALTWVRAFLDPNTHRQPTGHPGVDLNGITKSSGDANREKIIAFRKEFYDLHDRYPTAQEISKGTGVARTNVYTLMKSLNEGYHYAKKGRAKDGVEHFSLDPSLDDYGTYGVSPPIEELVLDQLRISELLSSLPKEQATILVMYYMLGYSQQEIAQTYWSGSISKNWVNRRQRLALEELRNQVVPM